MPYSRNNARIIKKLVLKGEKYMKPSQLAAIIKRLEVMMEDDGEIEVRRFEKDGNERCVVKYNRESQMFELEESASNQTYEFDDLDLVAIEIFELIQD